MQTSHENVFLLCAGFCKKRARHVLGLDVRWGDLYGGNRPGGSLSWVRAGGPRLLLHDALRTIIKNRAVTVSYTHLWVHRSFLPGACRFHRRGGLCFGFVHSAAGAEGNDVDS